MRFWNDERDAELRRLAKAGCGDNEIAAILGHGCNKNKVIGRRHRIGVELTQCQPGKRRPLMASAGPEKAPKTPAKAAKPSKPSSAPIPAPGVVAMPQPALAPVEMLFAPPKVDAPTGAGAAVLALRPSSCRWPLGNPLADDFHFCMAPHGAGVSYCREHERASWGKGTVSEQRAVKSAMKVSA